MYGHVPSTSVATRMSISGLIELAYNNSYKASIKMEPFKLLIGVCIDRLLDILNSRKPNFLAQILYKNPWRKLDIIKRVLEQLKVVKGPICHFGQEAPRGRVHGWQLCVF
uniref:Putative ovule protein n=1 Tax=Solanum chacoense TaxID=4108 RepID=A0A0V0HT84_SOLCH